MLRTRLPVLLIIRKDVKCVAVKNNLLFLICVIPRLKEHSGVLFP
jgi:hypothetical protein